MSTWKLKAMPQTRAVVQRIVRNLPPGNVIVEDGGTLTVMGFDNQGLKVHLDPDMALAAALSLGNAALAAGADESRALQLHLAARVIAQYGPQERPDRGAVQ